MTDQINTQEVEALFKLGAHLGHKKNRLYPKAKKFVHKMVDGVSIIDLTKTVTQLEKAINVLAVASKEGKIPLVVATKKVANPYTTDKCKEAGMPFMTSKWLPGMLTNFDTIIKNVRKLQTMKEQQASGAWEQFVKHERMKMAKEISKSEKLYGGLESITKKPDIMIIVDIKKEKNAVKEARANNLPIVALVDTNSNPDEVDYPIIVNDDAPAVIEYIMDKLIKAYKK